MKHLIRCFLLLILPGSLMACDLCNIYLGINPHYNQNEIGIRYRYRHFDPHNQEAEPGLDGDHRDGEYYNTYELWGRFYPHPKIQLLVSLPFVHNMEVESAEKTIDVKALGDVIAIAHYQVLNTVNKDSAGLQQRIFIGGGFKAPTGTFNKLNALNELDPHIQAGSGSWDLILSGAYLVKFGKAGITTDGNYRINSGNSNHFQFANRTNITANIFYQFHKKSLTFIPATGLYLEQAYKDKEAGEFILDSGGKSLFYSLSLECYLKRMAISLSGQLPVYEDLYGEQPQNTPRLIAGVSYSF